MSTVRLRKPPVATFVVVALVLVLGGGFFFAKSAGWLGRAPAARPAPVMTPDEITELVNRLSQQIPVPAGESPTVATIEDIDTLRSQNPEFYKEAENGDRLLVWSNTAILYSSKLEKVLNVLSIQLPTPTEPAVTEDPIEVPVVDVWNGTRTVGLSRIASDAVVAAGLKVGTIASARTTYPTTLIITADAQKYQQTLVTLQGFVPGTVIAEMPAGEAAMRGDILVIVGEDYQP